MDLTNVKLLSLNMNVQSVKVVKERMFIHSCTYTYDDKK